MKYILIFLLGAAGYSGIEVLWRGYTHWTMSVTGGVCFLLIYLLNNVFAGESLVFRCLIGAAVITSAELLVGVTVNIILKWNVWDYSALPFNFLGQICLRYFILWYFLCVPVTLLCTGIAKII